MRTTKKEMRETTVETGAFCDLCGGALPKQHSMGGAFSEIEVKAEVGSSWDGDRMGEEELAELCPPCWLEKVRPALVALGVKLQKRAF